MIRFTVYACVAAVTLMGAVLLVTVAAVGTPWPLTVAVAGAVACAVAVVARDGRRQLRTHANADRLWRILREDDAR